MKTIIAERTPGRIDKADALSWYFIPDSALVNTGKPFFLPDFSDDFEAILVPVVKINRLGKSISARFAPRYYTEAAAGIHFRATGLRRRLLDSGLPSDPSHSFDRSFTVGEFLPAEEFTGTLELLLERGDCTDSTPETPHIEVRRLLLDNLADATARLLEKVSLFNTVKMGDLLVPELSTPVDVKIGDILNVRLNDRQLFDIHIK